MESFEGVIEFVTVAEKQGFTAAAKHLACSTSHVSRQVNRLEARLGCALLARNTRMVSLTRAGEAYYQQCKDLVLGLQQANEAVSSQQVELSGTLRVSVAGTFAEMYVVPALLAFIKKHPALSLEIDFNSRMVNFVEDGFDFAIRYGQLKDSGLIARKLVNRSMMAAANPEYLAQFGEPQSIDELKAHQCIISNNDHWRFMQDGQEVVTKVTGRFVCNNANAVMSACQAGHGIAYLPKSNFTQLLAEKAVVPILEPFWNTDISSSIVYQDRRYLPSRARAAIDHLVAYFENWQE
ncbi:LysR family transcriptional regulator [Thalassotalea euphylliae]|uniref:LysR family transcriptional regulator n=1 Tax=Thalassotalea euphylliae TaxID=1655234 RepID=A0A3E0U5T5_9GAMM|nr:LysR family transcriptional regulator [Thalassotalea euphylliae]REL32110.1 LysR family transcriptional regulator [Thalassotalea euphylliae]